MRRRKSLIEAQGYHELGLHDEAWQLINDLPQHVREGRKAFGLRLKILAATNRWQQCQFLTKGLVQSYPAWPLPRLLGAEALDRQGETKLALAFLTAAEVHLQKEPGFWFQLGCYRAKLGNTSEAREAIAHLLLMAPDWQTKVKDEESLECVWNMED